MGQIPLYTLFGILATRAVGMVWFVVIDPRTRVQKVRLWAPLDLVGIEFCLCSWRLKLEAWSSESVM